MTQTPEEAMIVQLGRRWAAARGISESQASNILAGHAYLFKRLEGGKSVTLKTFDRIRAFLRDPQSWPEGTYPEDLLPLEADAA